MNLEKKPVSFKAPVKLLEEYRTKCKKKGLLFYFPLLEAMKQFVEKN